MAFDTANRGFVFGLVQVVMMWAAIGCAASVDCPKFLAGHKVGTVESPLITGASGLAASRKNPGVLWVHNDRGPPCVYAITPQGRHLGTYNLVGARNYNWEDIAIGPGPEPNVDYLYIGDIGDNSVRRKSVRVYRVAEPNVVRPIDRQISPQVDADQSPVVAAISDFVTIEMIYPDGPRDAETLMIDPLTKDLYIISKEGRSKVYRAAYPQSVFAKATADPCLQHSGAGKSTARKTTLEYVAKLPWGVATAGDISPDGQLIIVRNYFSASVWLRPQNGPLWRAFDNSECEVPLIVESQGEAICFDAKGAGYYTTSENRHQPIYYFPMDRQGKN